MTKILVKTVELVALTLLVNALNVHAPKIVMDLIAKTVPDQVVNSDA